MKKKIKGCKNYVRNLTFNYSGMKVIILFVILFVVYPLFGFSQFSDSGPVVLNQENSNASYLYPQVTAADSGYYVTWYDENQGFEMYMQFVDPKGEPQWANPLIVTDYPQDSWISDYSLMNDGVNAYVFFTDARNGLTDKDIFGYKINSQGEFLWGNAGVELIVSVDYDSDYSPNTALMPNGDVVAAWNKMDANGYSIRMQWLTATGERIWENGKAIAETDIRLFNPNLIPATDSTVYLVYTYQDGQYGDKQIQVQQIDTTGQNVWDSVLEITSNSGIFTGRRLALHPASDNGIYITWYGDPDGNTLNDVFTQHINVNGNMRYPSGGLNLSVNNQMNQTNPSCLGEDPQGNVMFVWHEVNSSYTNYEVRVQRVNASGELLLGENAFNIAENIENIGKGDYRYGNIYLPCRPQGSSKTSMLVYNLEQQLEIAFVEVGTGIETTTKMTNGQYVMPSLGTSNAGSDQVELFNVYRTGERGIEPVLSDSKLAGMADLAGFLPDSLFYFVNSDENQTWGNFVEPMNIYQNIEIIDTPYNAPGNYMVKAIAEDSSETYYQFSIVDELATNVDSVFSSDLFTHINTENQEVWAELQIVKELFHTDFWISPGARMYLNGEWDPVYKRINDSASTFFGFKQVDSAQIDFTITDYEGNNQIWHFMLTMGGGGIHSNDFNGSIYPNPVKNKLYIKSTENIQEVTLLTIDGRIVKQYAPYKSNLQIDVSSIFEGIYVLKVKQHRKLSNHLILIAN